MEFDRAAMIPLTSGALLENLKDAGCDLETAEQFMELEKQGAHQEQMRMLSRHRRHLLDCLHRDEKRIDCLDYLVDLLQKRQGNTQRDRWQT